MCLVEWIYGYITGFVNRLTVALLVSVNVIRIT